MALTTLYRGDLQLFLGGKSLPDDELRIAVEGQIDPPHIFADHTYRQKLKTTEKCRQRNQGFIFGGIGPMGQDGVQKVERAMRERKRGTLKSGRSGRRVTSRKQAIAIGLSEARRSGAKVPKRKSSRKGARKASSKKR